MNWKNMQVLYIQNSYRSICSLVLYRIAIVKTLMVEYYLNKVASPHSTVLLK